MSSPFPDMDPFIENQTDWSSFHNALTADISRELLDVLPPDFDARIEAHVYVLRPEPIGKGQSRSEFRKPDVTVYRPLTAPRLQVSSSVAVLERPQTVAIAEPELIAALPVRQWYIQIVDRRKDDAVVAVIEPLSPTNKDGRAGTQEYRRKQTEFLQSDVHLMEIDLLRGGTDAAMVERPDVELLGDYDYLVALRDADANADYRVWRIGLRDPLPAMKLPLTPDVPPVTLDLGAAFARCYDASFLARRTDYTKEPEPPLSPDDAAWADDLLRSAGLR